MSWETIHRLIIQVKMAMELFGFIWISPKEKRELSKDELRFLKYHEEEHRRTWYLPRSLESERIVQKRSIKRMLEEGYSFDELLQIELDYRFWSKYGLRFADYITFMRE